MPPSQFRVSSNVLFALFCTRILASVPYDGPVTSEYFMNVEANITANAKPLTCVDPFDELDRYWILTDTNATLGRSIYFGETTNDSLVEYYELVITEQMLASYTSIYVSTCCAMPFFCAEEANISACNYYFTNYMLLYALHYHHEDLSSNETAPYCSSNVSLDTYLYILQDKKNKLILTGTNDDSKCGENAEKSRIDLKDYSPGKYILAVGGFGTEYGGYYLHLECGNVAPPFPLSDHEEYFRPDEYETEIPVISCDDNTFDGTVNASAGNAIAYYSLNINASSFYLPAYITTSNWFVSIYLIREVPLNERYQTDIYYEEIDFDEDGFLTLDRDYYSNNQGEYYLVLQDPTIEPTTDPTLNPSGIPTTDPTSQPSQPPTPEPPKLEHSMMVGLIFGSGGAVLLMLIGYYMYQCIQYHRTKPSPSTETQHSRIPQIHDEDQGTELANLQLTTPVATSKMQQSLAPADASEEEEDDAFLYTRAVTARSGKVLRRLDSERDLGEQIAKNKDAIQTVLESAVAACEEQTNFDMYQVLALRYYDEESRKIQPTRPLKKLHIEWECVRLSQYTTTWFKAFVIAATQTWGISVMVYKLVRSYFSQGVFEVACDLHYDRWAEVFSLKILAFLLSLIVTFYISFLLKGVKNDGLYEIMYRLELKHIKRVNGIALWIVQIGQAINYYVCLVAVLGSYFIIFRSNTPEITDDGEEDYSQAGLDMILNAVALFFMLKLDDELVSEDDYDDCQKHLARILAEYQPDLTINDVYK